MVIRKMNSVFIRHGKYFFAVFTVIIIVAFVGFFTPGFNSMFTGDPSSPNSAVGKAFGKKVTRNDWRIAANNIMLSMALRGYDLRMPMLAEMANEQAFDIYVLTLAAKQCGIAVGDVEVADFIKSAPIFRGPKGFEMAKYEAFKKNVLKPAGFTGEDLDEAVRQALIVTELQKQILDNVIVTPDEVKTHFNRTREKYDVRSAQVLAKDYLDEVKLTDKDIESFYTANGSSYRMPARYKVDYIKIDYAAFDKKAKQEITDKFVKEYYEKNKEDFKKDGKIQALDLVDDQIRADLIAEFQKSEAVKTAKNFLIEAYKKIAEVETGRNEIFRQSAADAKFIVNTSDWVDIRNPKTKALPDEADFGIAVSAANLSKHRPISDTFMGKKSVFIAMLVEKEDERPAKFEEVKSQVEKDRKELAALQIAREKARNLVAEISTAPNQAKALAAYKGKIKFEKVPTFSLSEPPSSPDARMIINLASNTPAGSISQPEELPNGSMLVFVDKKTAPAPDTFEKDKAAAESECKQMKYMANIDSFSSWIRSQSQSYLQSNR